MKKPLADRIIVLPNSVLSVTESGIEIPDSSKPRPCSGIAVAVGDKCEKVKEGMTITYGKYAGQEFPIEGDENDYLIMRESEVLAID